MSWSKIKNAINSTIGTEDFKPLDKLVGDAFDTIVSEQNSIKQKLSTGENDFYVDRAKNVDIGGFLGVLEEYNAGKIATGSYIGIGGNDSHKVSLALPFAAKAIMIHTSTELNSSARFLFATTPCTNGFYLMVNKDIYASSINVKASVDGTIVTLELYDPTGSIQDLGRQYNYVALG